ncbi:MAG: hypothetical protein WC917_04820 [Bacilli bacterium]|jgi:hypothetical protein
MILFYEKRTGDVFATIDGRVHNKKSMECHIDNGIGKENIDKLIIGWEETDELEEYNDEVEKIIEVGDNLFKKELATEVKKRNKIIEHNIDKIDLLMKFEDTSPESPLDYRINHVTKEIIKKVK